MIALAEAVGGSGLSRHRARVSERWLLFYLFLCRHVRVSCDTTFERWLLFLFFMLHVPLCGARYSFYSNQRRGLDSGLSRGGRGLAVDRGPSRCPRIGRRDSRGCYLFLLLLLLMFTHQHIYHGAVRCHCTGSNNSECKGRSNQEPCLLEKEGWVKGVCSREVPRCSPPERFSYLAVVCGCRMSRRPVRPLFFL